MKFLIFTFFAILLFAKTPIIAQINPVAVHEFPNEYLYAPDRLSILNQKINLDEDKCNRFKKMKTAGMVMTFGGAAIGAGGTILFATFLDDFLNVDLSEEFNDADKFYLGAVGMVLGYATMSGGLVMWTIGNKKIKRYCGGSSLQIQKNKDGIGFALTF